MTDTLYLIDGMAFAFRAYYAIRTALTDNSGRPTNAVYGFTRVLLKLLREHNPTHIAVVFDAPGKTFRDDLFPAYKATRRETDEELKLQFPVMHEVVRALNLPLLVVPGVEADDVMGTLARQAEAMGMPVALVTGDKDLQQLVSDLIKVYDPNKGDTGMWYDRDAVVERFGVGPEHVVDALALIGDTADNVPGVRGIGDKTAKKLMETYGSLEDLYARIDEMKGKQKEKLLEDRDQAFFSRDLVTIKTDVPLDFGPDACVRQAWDNERVRAIFSSLGFHSLVEELQLGPAHADPATVDEKDHYSLVLTEAELGAVIAEIRAVGSCAVDTETTSVDPMRAELVGISLSCRDHCAYYIPVSHTAESMTRFRDPDDLTTAEQLQGMPRERILALLKPLLEDASVGKIGHNIKYDLIIFARAGVRLRGIALDTMVASYLTDPSRLRHNLDEVSLQYLRRKLIPISELLGKGSKAVTFDHVPIARACEYAAEDADVAWRLAGVLHPLLRERQLESLNSQVELPLIDVLAEMEQTGIAIDPPVFEALRREILERLEALTQEIYGLAGEEFKINSPKQLQDILFAKLGLTPLRKTKTGYSTDVDVLEDLAGKHPLPEKILEYRMLDKLRSTYVETLPLLRHPETGRIHSSFNQAVAATGRLSSSDPNLQNIPVRTEYGRRIRAGFVPGTLNRRLISADYSQIELRILAHLSNDENLRRAFEAGADIHRATAARVFGVDPDRVTSDMRRQAKAVNFGVVYGISAFGLARNLHISNAEAKRFIDDYFAEFPGVHRWLEETLAQARVDGYVMTLLNRRRYLPEFTSSDAVVRKAAERVAINAPVQGSAADIIKLAMIQLHDALAGSSAKLLLQVHDELVLEADAGEAEAIAAKTKEIMENAVTLCVPLTVEAGIGRNWAEIH
ncbi:MAG: DNA polymerase I [Candidatus Hydrogenedentes bacterium]|nr:DNA polymerase I [Candidatus Hydrogenedentota bacterium]